MLLPLWLTDVVFRGGFNVILLCVCQGLWVCSTCCCCGPVSSCCTTRASRPLSFPASWCGRTSSLTASSAPFSQSSSGSGEHLTLNIFRSQLRHQIITIYILHTDIWCFYLSSFLYWNSLKLLNLFDERTHIQNKCLNVSFSPQGLLPHIISNRDSGSEPHHPALYYGRYLYAEGLFLPLELLNNHSLRFSMLFVWHWGKTAVCREKAREDCKV